MDGWVKVFTDGSQEKGLDLDIAAGTASWSQGRFEGLVEVQLHHGDRVAVLSVPEASEWHQFDRMAVMVGEGVRESVRTHRVAQVRINKEHLGKFINIYDDHYWRGRAAIELKDDPRASRTCYVNESFVGKWLTISVPIILMAQADNGIHVKKICALIGDKGDWCG